MIAIKIQCRCGQKYAFDVEPVGQAMGAPVHCPVCGADGTTAANQAIADSFKPLLPPDLRLQTAALRSPSTTFTQFSGNRLSRPSVAQATRGKRSSRWFRTAFVGITILVLIVAVAGYVQQGRSRKADEPRVVGDGSPRTLSDFNAWYVEPPMGQNAATIYLQAFETLQTVSSSKAPLLGTGTMPAPDAVVPLAEKSAIAVLLRANTQTLLRLMQGSKYEESRYPIDLSRGFEVMLPHLPKLRSAALLLELDAVLHGEAHQGKEAADDVLAIVALSRSVALEPSLTSQFMRARGISIAIASWEQILNRTEVPKDSLGDLMNAFRKSEAFEASGEGFNRALAAERAIWTALLNDPQKLIEALSVPGVTIPPPQREETFARLRKGTALKTEQTMLDQVFAEVMDVRKSSFPGRLNADESIAQHITDEATRKRVVLGVLLPAFAGQSAREAESLARLRLGMAAVALEQFRIEHGSYPDDASKLIPEYLPSPILDPFNGEPLVYRKDGAGFVLHSVGSKSDGGNPDHRVGRITFAVRRSERNQNLTSQSKLTGKSL